MRQALKLHPDSRCSAARLIEVAVLRPTQANLVLQYFVAGKIADLRLPSVTASERADELWRHTCFEAFLRSPPNAAYYEFNFAPSTQWAAYQFSGYRSGMSVTRKMNAPVIDVQATASSYELQAALDLGELSGLTSARAWQLGLAAVIEERNGRKSYWALEHPPGKPDFHHCDGFAHGVGGVRRS